MHIEQMGFFIGFFILEKEFMVKGFVSMSLCPCGSKVSFLLCCKPYHNGKEAMTAEQLMRSRYVAYAMGIGRYVYKTWHPSTRPEKLSLIKMEQLDWQSLEILNIKDGQAGDEMGWVAFNAHYNHEGKEQVLHENSRFVHEKGRWWYLEAILE